LREVAHYYFARNTLERGYRIELITAQPSQDGTGRLLTFMSLADARNKLENWTQDYNYFWPHSALADTPPALFARQFTVPPNPSDSLA